MPTKPKRRHLRTEKIPQEGSDWALTREVYSREPGSGSVDKVTRKGKEYFRARVWLDDEKGVRKRRSVYAVSEAKLAKKLKELQTNPTAPRNAKALTVGDFLTSQYLPDAKLRVRQTTFESYEIAVRVHIIPTIGKARLKTFSASNASAWLSDLDAGARARQNAFKVLKQAMTFANNLDLIPKNPLARLKAPKAPRKVPTIFTLSQVQKLLRAAEGTPAFVLVYTAVATSMRTSELFGLTWADVDLRKGFVRVRQQAVKTGDGLAFGPLKTDASNRRIDLPEPLLKLLQAHRKSQGENPHDLIFPSPSGGFMQKDNFTKRVWLPLLEAAGLPHATFYSLRHVGNTLLISRGYSVKLAQARMGHDDSKLTIETYAFLGETEGRKGAKLLGTLLGKWDTSGGQPRSNGKASQKPGKQKNLTA